MSNVPDGAQLSEDGNYWWDGTQWQSVHGGSQTGSGDEEPPNPPTDDEIQRVWAEADIETGGTGDVASKLADTVTNVCDQICFFYPRHSDGSPVFWFRSTICAESHEAIGHLLLLIVEGLQRAGYRVHHAESC